jgi:hypothetical protein
LTNGIGLRVAVGADVSPATTLVGLSILVLDGAVRADSGRIVMIVPTVPTVPVGWDGIVLLIWMEDGVYAGFLHFAFVLDTVVVMWYVVVLGNEVVM